MTATPEEGGFFQQVQAFRRRHELAEIILIFVAGFVFDAATLRRLDELRVIIQQGAYLVALILLLALDRRQALLGDLPARLAKAMPAVEKAIHFFLGALMSTFTLNYFKSGSGLTSLAFVAVVFVFLVANEFPRFRRYGPVVRFALLSFCLLSYFAYLGPVLTGQVRPWMFVAAAAASVVCMAGIFLRLLRWAPRLGAELRRSVLPGLGVQAVLLALYFAKVIPPVPLALTYMGIYHYVEAPIHDRSFVTDDRFRLLTERPWWLFWHHGDQLFYARDGDQVFCFYSVFAPNNFQDQVNLVWSRWNDAKGEWVQKEKAATPLGRGGVIKESGWRWVRSKALYEPGEWRAEVQTEDGRTIGSLRFTIYRDTRTEPRQFVMDLR